MHRPTLPRSSRHALPRAVAGVVVVLLAVLGLSANTAAAAVTPPGKGWVRAAHLIPGAGPVRIDLAPEGGGPAASVQMSPDADYGDVTDYQQLTPGTYTVTVRRPGDPAGADPMLSRSFAVRANQAYTLAALGTREAPRLIALPDDLTPPAAGTARVRLLPAAGTVSRVSVRAKNGPTIATDAVLGQVTPYAAVTAGNWTLDASAAGDQSATAEVAVAGGSVYTVLVLDDAGGGPRLALVTDSSGAVMSPSGGVATGAGGTAGAPPGPGARGQAGIGIGALVVAGLAILTARRRSLRRRHAAAAYASGR